MDNRLIFLYLVTIVISWGVTTFDQIGVEMTPRLSRKTVLIGKSVRATLSGDEEFEAQAKDNQLNFKRPRKASQSDCQQTVPITDTGGLVGNTKASERTFLKEFGKLAGRKLAICPARRKAGHSK